MENPKEVQQRLQGREWKTIFQKNSPVGGRWIGLGKTQGKKLVQLVSKQRSQGVYGKERASVEGLVVNGMMGKKGRNARNNPKIFL